MKSLKQLNVINNLIYVLADVIETNLMDLETGYKMHGKMLRHESRRNFNTALHGLRQLKSELKPSPMQEQTDYGNDADIINALILLIVDRTGDDDMAAFRLYNYIKAMPSRLHMELDIDEASVFGHALQASPQGLPR